MGIAWDETSALMDFEISALKLKNARRKKRKHQKRKIKRESAK